MSMMERLLEASGRPRGENQFSPWAIVSDTVSGLGIEGLQRCSDIFFDE